MNSKVLLFFILLLRQYFLDASSPDLPDKPNILIFIADDAGLDFGCYGNMFIKTPNIDRLAKEGMLCKNAFLTSSQCSPSRTSILSGQFAHTIGTEDLHYPLNEHTRLVPYYLKQKGYYTGILMKQHLGENGINQFDYIQEGTDDNAPEIFKSFLDNINGQPFFAWVAFHDPHRPYGGPHGAEKVHQPANVIVSPYFVDTQDTRNEIALYYDEIHRLDNNIGKILKELEKRKLRKNTLLIFLSDNGMPFPRCKATAYDYGIKTPLIIHWEGNVSKSTFYEGMISVIDLAPTILDVAGINKPAEMYGESIKEIFNDQYVEGRKYIFTERNWHDTDDHVRSIRSNGYKLIVNSYPELLFPITGDYTGSNVWFDLLDAKAKNELNHFQNQIFEYPRYQVELYDLNKDPYEVDNLIGKKEYQKIAIELNKLLLEWQEETNDYPSSLKRRSDFIDRKSGFYFLNKKYTRDYKNYGYWGD